MAGALAVIAIVAGSITASPPQDTLRARALWLDALDREAVLDLDSGLVLLHAAREADPWSWPVQRRYLLRLTERGVPGEGRRTSPGDQADASLDCYDVLFDAPYGYRQAALDSLAALDDREGHNLCSALALAGLSRRLTPASEWSSRGVEWARWATREAPHLAEAWDEYAQALSRAGFADEAESAMRRAIAESDHPMMRVARYVRLAGVLMARGDTTGARTLAGTVEAAVERDRRPGLRVVYLHGMASLSFDHTEREALASDEAELARRYGAWSWELRALWTLCSQLDAGGSPAAASRCNDRAVEVAQQAGSPALSLRALVLRGRARYHMGHLGPAASDLEVAITRGRLVAAPTWLAQAQHNLAHLREAEGRLDVAARAAEAFAATAAPLEHWSARMMSLRDLGMIRWKAGWHAAANDAFSRMVRVVDDQESNFHWAGEHFERMGDLEAALHYYRRAAAEPAVLSVTWAALARVFDDLGMPDSARAAARKHDEHTDWGPFDAPLLPEILSEEGRFDEAGKALRAWAVVQEKRQNIRGTAIALTRLGEVQLRGGRPDSALVQAIRAESLAVAHKHLEEVIDARRLKGEAMMRAGSVDEGVATLRELAALATSFPTRAAARDVHLALGEALSEAGRPAEALQALSTAAEAMEETSASLWNDLDRARYRARNLDPYEAAIGLLLEARSPDPDALLRWSQRRKGAALAQSAARALGGSDGPLPALTLGAVRRALARREALLDYVVLDSAVAVTVVAGKRTGSLILPIDSHRLDALVDRLRRPMVTSYAGRVDIARAGFDAEGAGDLYQALVAPVLPLVGDADRLVVVPDGSIHDLPLDALMSGPVTALVDDYEVVELPSVRFLAGRRQDRMGPGTDAAIMVLAVDAPGVEEEIASIRAQWPAVRMAVRTDAAATETVARTQAAGYQIVHFAAHALADQSDPLASHIRLTADGENDGFLHASEIVEAAMPVQLAVLSACETSTGRYLRGEGLMSLGRAFLAGGARAVIGTLWPVGAGTAQLMEAFYARLATGMAPAAALRAAKLALRRDPATSHPFFWAGFVFMEGAGRGD